MVAVLGLATALLTGCGEDQTKVNNRYVAATDRVVQSFETEFQGLQADFTQVSTPKQDLATLGRLRTAVDRVVARLGQVEPPDAIAALHRQLIARVASYGDAIAAAQEGFGSSDEQVVNTARTTFSATLRRVESQVTATITQINAKLK